MMPVAHRLRLWTTSGGLPPRARSLGLHPAGPWRALGDSPLSQTSIEENNWKAAHGAASNPHRGEF